MMAAGAATAVLASASVSAAADPPAPKDVPAEGAPAAPQPAPKDVVKLKNGGLLRGSIAELVPGEFVVIVLITGETRRVPAAEFDYAGPDRADAEQAEKDGEQVEEPKPRSPPGKIVHNIDHRPIEDRVNVRSTGGALKVYVRAPAAGQGKRFTELCKTPCDVTLAPGEYEMALSQLDSSRAMEARDRVRITGSENLEATYKSRAGTRAAGAVILILGTLGGVTLIATAESDCSGGSCGADTSQVAIGGLLAAGSLAAGIVMLTRNDVTEIDVVPATAVFLPSRGALAGIPDASGSKVTWPGLGIAARF